MFKIRGVGRPKKVKTALFFEPSYISELWWRICWSCEAVAAVDDDENIGDDASDLEPEPTVPKAITTKKVAVPKISKRGPRGPYKKKP